MSATTWMGRHRSGRGAGDWAPRQTWAPERTTLAALAASPVWGAALIVGLVFLAGFASAPMLRGVRRCAGWAGRTALFAGLTMLAVAANPPAAVPPAASSAAAFQVQITGQGRPIILIPGLSSSGPGTWAGTVAHLRGHYRCYVLTLAGFAGVPPIQAPLLATARDQLAAYIAAHHLDHPVIVGHSLGGNLALDLAARYPDRVGPVVIVDSLPFYAGAWFQVPNLAAAQPTIAQMRAGMQGMSDAQWQAYARSGASTNSMATSPADQKKLIAWSVASDRRTVTDAMLGLVNEDLRPELPKITAPVLVIGTWIGLQQYRVTEAQAEALFRQQYAGLKHWQFVMADRARHFVMWDEPAWFYRQLDGFLAAHQ